MSDKSLKLDPSRLLGCRLLGNGKWHHNAIVRQCIGAKVGGNGKVTQQLPSIAPHKIHSV